MAGALLGAIAGAALATLPGRASGWTALFGAVAGGVLGGRFAERQMGFSPWSLALLAFFAPVFTMAVAPGADMAMHVALARGLLGGVLSPAWPGAAVAAYPRGFSALVALLSPVGLARAGLIASAISYLVFWAGLAAVLQAPFKTPSARTVAAVAILLSRTPQIFFGWGGNATAMALGLSLFGAAQPAPIAALYLAGAAATHPMGALAGGLVAALVAVKRRAWRWTAAAAAGLGAVLGALALFGPALSPRELLWIRDYAAVQEPVPLRSLGAAVGDPAAIVTGIAAAVLLFRRQFGPVLRALAQVTALGAVLQLLPLAGLYPVRFAPLLLIAIAPVWSQAAAARTPMLAPVALLAALWWHGRWYQEAEPMATRADVAAIECVAKSTRPGEVIDGAYGDATQWIPALAGRAVTRPHQHVSLFDETDAALARLPRPSWRFVGDVLRYGPPISPPPVSTPLCSGHLYKL